MPVELCNPLYGPCLRSTVKPAVELTAALGGCKAKSMGSCAARSTVSLPANSAAWLSAAEDSRTSTQCLSQFIRKKIKLCPVLGIHLCGQRS